jgi:lysozyme
VNHRDILRAQLRVDEDEVPWAYQDSEGYWTIGVGRLIDKRKGGRLRKDEMALMLENDITEAEFDAAVLFPTFSRLSANRKAVLCNMAFNLGRQGLAAFKKLREAIEAEAWEQAAAEMQDSLWAKQTGNRAIRLIKMMREG